MSNISKRKARESDEEALSSPEFQPANLGSSPPPSSAAVFIRPPTGAWGAMGSSLLGGFGASHASTSLSSLRRATPPPTKRPRISSTSSTTSEQRSTLSLVSGLDRKERGNSPPLIHSMFGGAARPARDSSDDEDYDEDDEDDEVPMKVSARDSSTQIQVRPVERTISAHPSGLIATSVTQALPERGPPSSTPVAASHSAPTAVEARAVTPVRAPDFPTLGRTAQPNPLGHPPAAPSRIYPDATRHRASPDLGRHSPRTEYSPRASDRLQTARDSNPPESISYTAPTSASLPTGLGSRESSHAPDRPRTAASHLVPTRETTISEIRSTWSPTMLHATGSQSTLKQYTVAFIIRDTRDGDEMQYAEVRVPLEPGSAGDCYLARCQDVVNALQASAGRIDGSAKIYCERQELGSERTFKQYLLRMSDTEYIPSEGTVKIPQSLELRITVEKLVITKPQPHHASSLHTAGSILTTSKGIASPLGSPVPVPPPRTDGRVAIPPTPQQLRPLGSKSLIPGYEKVKMGKLQHPTAHWPKPRGAKETGPVAGPSNAMSDNADTKSVKLKKAMADYVRPLIQKEAFWPMFSETKGHVKSNADAVKSLRFFEDMTTKYVHTVIPPHVPLVGGKRITKASLLEAVGRGTTWGSDCHIVLGLVERFGPGGPEENQEVVELLSKTPGDKKGGIAEFVNRLKKIRDETDARRLAEQAADVHEEGEAEVV